MFTVRVIADNENKETPLKKGEIYTVLHVHWHILSALENRDQLWFLIYNPTAKRFIFELCSNFELVPHGHTIPHTIS